MKLFTIGCLIVIILGCNSGLKNSYTRVTIEDHAYEIDCKKLVGFLKNKWYKHNDENCYYLNSAPFHIVENSDCLIGMDFSISLKLLGPPTILSDRTNFFTDTYECRRTCGDENNRFAKEIYFVRVTYDHLNKIALVSGDYGN